MTTIAVIGLGYVGLPLAVEFGKKYKTYGFDLSAEKAWLDALYSMRYDNPAHREMMDLEGLKAWLPGRTTGFGPLTAAVESERFFAPASP